MNKVTFDQLLLLYQNTAFDEKGDGGRLTIADADVLALVQSIDGNDRATTDANFSLGVDPDSLNVGQVVPVTIGPPRVALGYLVRDFDALLKVHEAKFKEPSAYFIISGAVTKKDFPSRREIIVYRKALELISLMTEAAAYRDDVRLELVFIKDGKFSIPLEFDAKTLKGVSVEKFDLLLSMFIDDVHRDQKLAIFSEALMQMTASQEKGARLEYILLNVENLIEEVRKGYKLFASSFSYTKIRGELENARVEYLNKIHRTLTDIQGQLLGIPVATVIVASQLKTVTACGLEFWTNVAVVAGAWIFILLLMLAIINQAMTLSTVSKDISIQKLKLKKDYFKISEHFVDIFLTLESRMKYQYVVLGIIGLVAIIGAMFATYVAYRLNTVDVKACVAGNVSSGGSAFQPATDSRLPPSMHPPSLPLNPPK